MDTPVRQYRLLEDALPDTQKRAANRRVMPQLAVLATAMIISVFLLMRARDSLEVPIAFALFTALGLTYLAFVPARRARRRLARCWETYVLSSVVRHN
jgi:hypothetical protein